jgi:uncharacterized protein (DUF2141 family)
MMKKSVLVLFIMMNCVLVFAKEHKVSLKITNVIPNGGNIIIGIHDSKEQFDDQKSAKDFIIDSSDLILEWSYSMEEGEYVISVYQDKNGNGHIDYSPIRTPKEPYGFTNYTSKTIPSYKKLKFNLDSDKEFVIPLFEM